MAHRRPPRPKVSEGERESTEQELLEEEEAILQELGVIEGVLSKHQLKILAALDRLEKSLHGPQHLLEVAGGFSRPTPPPVYTPFTTSTKQLIEG
jgi:hypothetical protein